MCIHIYSCFFYFPAMIICLVGYQGKRRGSVIWLLHHDMAVYMTRTWYTYANQKLSSWWNHIGVSHCINRHAFQLSSLLGSSACNVNPLPSVRLKKIQPNAFRSVWPPLHMHVMTATSLPIEPTCQKHACIFSKDAYQQHAHASRDQLELDASFLPFPEITIKIIKALAPSHVVGAHPHWI